MKTKINKGFTLIEVMIALSVVAIGLMATLKAINQEISGSSITQNKMIALWLLQNKVAEIRLNSTLPIIGLNQGKQILFNQTWQWQTETKATVNPKIRKVEVSISLPAQNKLLSQSIYLGDIK